MTETTVGPATGTLRRFSRDVTKRAATALARPGVVAVDWVTGTGGSVLGSNGRTRYRIRTDYRPGAAGRRGTISWVTCTCANGQHQGQASCYHAAAVLVRLRNLAGTGFNPRTINREDTP